MSIAENLDQCYYAIQTDNKPNLKNILDLSSTSLKMVYVNVKET